MDTIEKHGKTIGIIAGIAVIAAGAFLLFKKADKEDFEEAAEAGITEIGSTTITPAQKQAILNKVNVAYTNGHLTFDSIRQICDATLEFAAPTFVTLTKKDRRDRRNNRGNLSKYIQLWNEYAAKLEELIEGSQTQVLQGLNVTADVWEASNSFYMQQGMQQGNNDLMLLHASLPQKLKMNIGSTRELNNIEFKDILNAQIQLLNNEADHADEIMGLIENPNEVAPIIQNKVNDEIFEKYNIEEEDIFRSMRSHIMDPEVQQLFMQLQQVTMRMLPQQGGGFF